MAGDTQYVDMPGCPFEEPVGVLSNDRLLALYSSLQNS
jgi:hypothetical protein